MFSKVRIGSSSMHVALDKRNICTRFMSSIENLFDILRCRFEQKLFVLIKSNSRVFKGINRINSNFFISDSLSHLNRLA
jgi:hypothetical protein